MRETHKAELAKAAYIAMGPDRSLRKLCLEMGRRPNYVRQLKEWSHEHGWQAQAEEADVEEAGQEAASEKQRRRDAKEERLRIIRGLRVAGQNILAELLKAMQSSPESLESLGLKHLLAYLPNATRVLETAFREERLDLGEAISRTEVTGADGAPMEHKVELVPDLSAFTLEELQAIREIHDRANARRDQQGIGEAPP